VQADPANFGVVTLGRHATAMLTVRHEGFGPAHISALRVTGRNPGDFTVPSTACQATIYEADTCTLPVTFTPRAPGPRSGVVQLTTDTSGTVGAASVSGGAVTPISLMSFTPGQATFGPQTVQTSSVITVQGVNTSNDPVTISSIVPTLGAGAFPGDYSVSGTCVGVIQPHATCVEAITFSPHGPGVRPDMLAFVDSTGAQITMSVTGRGLLPTASLGPQAVPDGQVVTVRGNDFPPNYPVVATIPTLDGQASTASVTTDATGAFVASIVIFPNAEQGLQPVVVTAPETTVQLTLPLLVTRHLDITPYLGS
jgi:hypothetical protein